MECNEHPFLHMHVQMTASTLTKYRHLMHVHSNFTCLSALALYEAIHEQQALLTRLAPLHWQAQNIREEDTHKHTHTHMHANAHIDRDGEQKGQRGKMGGEKRGREHCNTRGTEDETSFRIQTTDRKSSLCRICPSISSTCLHRFVYLRSLPQVFVTYQGKEWDLSRKPSL